MHTEFGEKLQTALNSIDSLTWKEQNGSTIKLVDATAEQLSN